MPTDATGPNESEWPAVSLPPDTYAVLLHYAQVLKLPPQRLAQEALEAFFAEIEKQSMEKGLSGENAETSLSFDEFWDGVDV